MGLAQNLLNSLTDSEPEEDLTTLVIDHYTRTIHIPKGITTLGVTNDDDVLILDFKMPRYLRAVDLSTFSIRINYINANGDDDVYKVTDARVVGDDITFSWRVGPTATAYKGATKFNVCMVITDSNSVIKQEYNTAVASLPVLEGLECSERVISEYTDILEQWEHRLFGISDTEEAKLLAFSEEQQENIANKGAEVLATIPEEYQTTAKLANEGVRTKADAIICSAEGATITVHDSSDDHVRGLKIFGKTSQVKTTGKNLLNNTLTTRTTYGITATTNVDDKSITVDGTATGNAFIEVGTVTLPAGTYILSGCPSGGSTSTYTMYVLINGQYYWNNGSEKSFTVNEEKTISVSIRVMEGVAIDNARFYPMVSVEGGAYEPYTGGKPSPSPDYPQELASIKNSAVTVYGKNLLRYPYTFNTRVMNGVTFTVNDDGSIKANGTATAGISFHLQSSFTLPAGEYVISGCPYGGSLSTYRIYFSDNVTKTVADYGTTSKFTLAEEFTGQVIVQIISGAVLNNLTFYPMIRRAYFTDNAYEPYVEAKTIAIQHTLPGIPVTSGGNYTDSNGQQWICDEIDFERGVYVQRVYAMVSDYSSGWKISGNSTTNHNAFYRMNTSLPTMIKGTNNPVICTHFTTTRDPVADHTICVSGGLSNQEVYFFVPKSEFPDVETWTDYVLQQSTDGTPITTYYILDTPIETPLTADELAAFQALKSNYPNTTVLNDAGAWMNLRYNADTETWITNLIDEKIAAAVAKL